MTQNRKILIKNGKKFFFRFSLHQRIQHGILAIIVIVLVLTGMPLKFPDAFWAPYLYNLFGGIKCAPVVHKVAGVFLLLLFGYHLLYLIHTVWKGQIVPLKKSEGLTASKILKLLSRQSLVPNKKDAKDIVHLVKYLLFLSDTRPDGAEFTWKEKFDFWAPFWGVIIIGGSGLILWNKELATMVLPGQIINFALIAHSDEALLAMLFLFIWHWYNVHFSTSVFPMGTSFLTGYLSEELMVEDHYEHYVNIMKEEGFEDEILRRHGRPAHKPQADGVHALASVERQEGSEEVAFEHKSQQESQAL